MMRAVQGVVCLGASPSKPSSRQTPYPVAGEGHSGQDGSGNDGARYVAVAVKISQ